MTDAELDELIAERVQAKADRAWALANHEHLTAELLAQLSFVPTVSPNIEGRYVDLTMHDLMECGQCAPVIKTAVESARNKERA